MEKNPYPSFCKNFFKGKCVEHRKRLNLKLGECSEMIYLHDE